MASRTIPMLEEPRVQARPLPTVYSEGAPESVFGAGQIGRALTATGEEVARIAANERQKADAFAAAGLEEAFAKEVRPLLYDKDRGFFVQEGEGALDAQPTLDSIEKVMQKYAKLARNGDQKEAFLRRARSRAESWTTEIDKYSTGQRKKYYDDKAGGQMGLALDTIGQNYNNPEEIEKELRRVGPLLILHWSDNEKLPIEEVQRRWAAFQSEAFNRAMEGYFGADDGIGGLKFLNAAGTRERLGKYASGWEAKLRPIAYKQQGEVLAEEAFQLSFGKLEGAPHMPPEQWAQAQIERIANEARERGEPLPVEVFDKANEGLQRRQARWRAGYNADSVSLLGSARTLWESKGHDLGAIPEHLRVTLQNRWDSEGNNEWHKLEATDKAWKDAHRADATPPTMAQRRALVQFMLDLGKTPHKFDNWDESRFYKEIGWQLHPTDYEQAGGALGRMQARPDKLTVGLAPIMAMYDRLGGMNGAFPNMHDPEKPENKNLENWDQYDVDVYYEGARKIQEWLADWHKNDDKNKGRVAPSLEEYQEFINTMVAQGRDPDGGWFGLGKKSVRLRAEVGGTAFDPDPNNIPASIRGEIKRKWAAEHKAGRIKTAEPTEAEIRKVYTDAYRIKGPPRPASNPAAGFNVGHPGPQR